MTVCNKIRYMQRPGTTGAVKLYGSNTSPTANLVFLADLPNSTVWNIVNFVNTVDYDFYVCQNYAEFAEVEFYNPSNAIIPHASIFSAPPFNSTFLPDNAFDGNTTTAFATNNPATAWIGIQCMPPPSRGTICTKIRYMQRAGTSGASNLYGSQAAYTGSLTGFVLLSALPNSLVWNTIIFPNPTYFAFLTCINYAEFSEVEFYDAAGVKIPYFKIFSAPPFNPTFAPELAFDGDTLSAFATSNPATAWIGIQLIPPSASLSGGGAGAASAPTIIRKTKKRRPLFRVK